VRELMARGAGSAIVSLGSAGLVGCAGDRTFLVTPPKLTTRSSVGCGDATVAGLAVALERNYEKPEQLAFAAACGAANCLAQSRGRLDSDAVESLRSRVQTRWLD
jgi:fructose-1-phosphate kinase PfkB-like protein